MKGRLADAWSGQAGDQAEVAGLGCRQEGLPQGTAPAALSPLAVPQAGGTPGTWLLAFTGGNGAVSGARLSSDSSAPSRWSQGSSPGTAGPGSSPASGQGWGWGQARHTSAHSRLPLPRHSPPTPCPGPQAGPGMPGPISALRGGGVWSCWALPAHQLNCDVCDEFPRLTLLVTFNPLSAASRSTKQPPGTSRRYSLSGVS